MASKESLSAPPVLSTPDTRLLSETLPPEISKRADHLSDEQLSVKYEIQRTLDQIKSQRWQRIALQFPDSMLPDSARIYRLLARGIQHGGRSFSTGGRVQADHAAEEDNVASGLSELSLKTKENPVKLTILGDTSYGSCCVDEIAAEHVDADAIIHYGRACLSPTARLPVLHVFTKQPVNHESVVDAAIAAFPDRSERIIITADIPYSHHVESITNKLQQLGYHRIFAAQIVHDPSSPMPNRTVPGSVAINPDTLSDWHLFHISDPPTALLLSVASRTASVRIFPTTVSADTQVNMVHATTAALLRRRYALITSLTTVAVWGILINTLSVKNYLQILDHVRSQISKAGKKSYLFVVGKLNAAKVANFSEIGGWVVIGCWESSLIDSKDFYRPIITPFELELALQPDRHRMWTGKWRADFEAVLENSRMTEGKQTEEDLDGRISPNLRGSDSPSDDEDEPPEFDLRTGRYVSRSRPMPRTHRLREPQQINQDIPQSHALTKRLNGEIVAVNGVASPAAEYLHQKRTWRGLGSDFEIQYEDDVEGSVVEEGRTGVARGYAVGDSGPS